MIAFYGFVGLMFFIFLFKKKWKIAGVTFVIILILTPLAGKSMEKESAQNYEQAVTAIKNEDYDKAEELFSKVKDNDKKHYELAQEELKKIKDIKVEKYASSAQNKYNNGDYEGAKNDLEQAVKLNEDSQMAKDLLNLVNNKIKDKDDLAKKEENKTQASSLIKIDDEKKKQETKNDEWLPAGGNLYIGTELYMKNEDKMEKCAKILELNKNQVKILELPSGDVYWKNREKMITSGVWFVKKN